MNTVQPAAVAFFPCSTATPQLQVQTLRRLADGSSSVREGLTLPWLTSEVVATVDFSDAGTHLQILIPVAQRQLVLDEQAEQT